MTDRFVRTWSCSDRTDFSYLIALASKYSCNLSKIPGTEFTFEIIGPSRIFTDALVAEVINKRL